MLAFIRTQEFGAQISSLLTVENELFVAAGTTLWSLPASLEGHKTHRSLVCSGVRVTHMWADRQCNIWASTETKGLLCVSGLRRFVSFPDRPDVGAIFAIRQRPTGAQLLAGDNGIVVPDGKNRYRKQMVGTHCWDVLEHHLGEIVIATNEGVLTVDNNNHVSPLLPGEPLLAGPARVLCQIAETLWVGTLAGLVRVDNEIATAVVDADGRSLGYIYSLHEDHEAQLWISTLGRGLWHLTDGEVHRYMPAPIQEPSNTYCVDVHHDGSVAIVADGLLLLGQNCWPKSQWIVKQLDCAAWAIRFANNDRIMVGTSKGIHIFTRQGKLLRKICPVLDADYWETPTSRCLAFSRENTLLCGLNSGLAEINTDALDTLPRNPIPYLSKLEWVNAIPVDTVDGVSVITGKWSLSISIRTDWQIDRSDCLIRFRLKGFDIAWHADSASGDFRYTSLPEGTYQLQAQIISPMCGEGPRVFLKTLHVLPVAQALCGSADR